jgi:hypothetical protein
LANESSFLLPKLHTFVTGIFALELAANLQSGEDFRFHNSLECGYTELWKDVFQAMVILLEGSIKKVPAIHLGSEAKFPMSRIEVQVATVTILLNDQCHIRVLDFISTCLLEVFAQQCLPTRIKCEGHNFLTRECSSFLSEL